MQNQQPKRQSLREVKAELEMFQDMFAHPGWKKFISDNSAQLRIDQDNAPETFKTNDEWQYFRGHVNFVKKILSFEIGVENTLAAINETISDAEAVDDGSDDF